MFLSACRRKSSLERNIGDGGFKEVIKDEQNGNGGKPTSYSAHPPQKDSGVAKYCRIKENCGHGKQRMAGVVKKRRSDFGS